jgi:hypothetical protein
VTASTISGNSATTGGGINGTGITQVLLDSSVIAGNTAPTDPDVDSTVTSTSAYNLIGIGTGVNGIFNGMNHNQIGTSFNPINPQLAQLGLYGGPTPTMALLTGSPANGTGDPNAKDANGNVLTVDQRGFARPHGTGATPAVGTYQPQTNTHFVVTTQQTVTGGTSFTITVAAVDQYNNLLTGYTGTVGFTSSDANAILPANYTFITGNQGEHTFTVTLPTAGTQTVMVTDTGTPSATGAATVTVTTNILVTNTNDSGTGSLRWAIATANAQTGPSTITFSALFNSTQTITLTSGPLTLTNPTLTTIQGPGASLLTVSGNSTQQVFVVNLGASATVSGVTLSRGLSSVWGNGGDVDNMGTLTLSNATITSATGDGVYNSGTLTLTGDTISGNSTLGVYNSGTLALTNSSVTGNGTSGAFNGGVLNSGTLTATGDTISGNNGTGSGLFNSGTAGVFSSTVSGGGGGEVFNGGTLTVAASTVSNGAATLGAGLFNGGTATVSTSTLSGNGNSSTANGGASFTFGALTLVSSTLNGNTAANGGGIFNGGTLTATSDTIAGNTANNDSGGGIYNANPSLTALTLDSTIVGNNTATYGPDIFGAAAGAYNLISSGSGMSGITNGSNNNQVGVNPLLNPLANNGGPTQTMSLQSSSPARNAGDPNAADAYGNPLASDQRGSARPHGTGQTPDIGAYDSHSSPSANHLVIAPPTSVTAGQPFTFTVTAENGSGQTVTTYSGTVTFTSSDASASLPPGTTLINGVGTFTATLNSSGFQTITATDQTFGIQPMVDGTVVVADPTFTVTSTSDPALTQGQAPVAGTLRWAVAQANATQGPAIIAFAPSFYSSAHTITLTADTGTATAGNGPLVLANTTSTTIVGPGASLLTISGGTVNGTGGTQVLLVDAGAVTSISGVTISQGMSPFTESAGGVFNGGTLTLTNSTLSGNGSNTAGSAIFNSGALTMSGDTVSNNTNSSNTTHGIENVGTLSLTLSTVSGSAATFGGGLLNSGAAAVTTSTISGNTAGGGVYNTGALAVLRSTISGNTDALPGGGIDNIGVLTLTLSTVGGNTSSSVGGGIENVGTLIAVADTITANTATRGSGIDNQGTLYLDSSLVAANGTNGDIWGGAAVTSAYNLIGNGSTLSNLTNGTNSNQIGTSANPINPLLGPLANNGGPTQTYALLSGSPALGAGDVNAKDPNGNLLTTDQRGNTRIVNGHTDIGSGEF